MVKRDYILIAALLAAACAIYLTIKAISGGDSVIIRSGGEVFGRYPLNENAKINVKGGNTVVIEDGEAYVSFASCPDKLCMHQGRIHDSSKSIVCLPNKMTVSISGNSGVDAVAGGVR